MISVNSSEKPKLNSITNTVSSKSSADLTVQSTNNKSKTNEIDELDLSSYTTPSTSDLTTQLKSCGFIDKDIKRITNGEISPDELLLEIEKDHDSMRKKKIMESEYLQNYKSSLVHIRDSKVLIEQCEENIKTINKQKKELERSYDHYILTNFAASIKNGSSYEDTLKKTAIWIDENGNKYYQKPVATREQSERKYTEITYETILGLDNPNLLNLKNSLKDGKWTGTQEQENAYNDVYEISQQLKKEKEETLVAIDEQLNQLKKSKKQYKENATDVEFNFNNLEELNQAKVDTGVKLKKLQEEQKKLQNDSTVDMLNMVSLLKNDYTLDEVLNKTVLWIDENGRKYTVDPTFSRENAGKTFTKITYRELYKDRPELNEIKNVLMNGKWTNNTESDDLYQKISSTKIKNEERLKQLEKDIKFSEESYALYDSAYKNINSQIEYYLNNIDKYTNKDDFRMNNKFNDDSLKIVENLTTTYQKDTSTYKQSPKVNDKKQVTTLLYCMINNKGISSDGNIVDKRVGKVHISSDDSLYENMQSWIPFMTDTEKEVFNYIYNTEGAESARKYLENISDALDKRYVADKQQKDQDFAENHPVLATGLSIVKQPLEGMNAAYYSVKSLCNDEKIRRTNVYSSSEVYRQKVGQDIAENYGEGLAFLYNTGTSMADSGLLILTSAATGGTAGITGKLVNIGLSATLMGSRSYVSTLNDALDRGIPDGSAIALAFTSSITESLMESYSTGHLLNLENTLATKASSLATKIGGKFTSPALKNIATKTSYIALGALSQGLCEGEEEFTTEIVNYFVDNLISGDLSNHTLTINKYMNLGYTEDDARKIANVEYVHQLGSAFLGGFTSGVLFGAGGMVHSNAQISKTISTNMLNDYVQSGKTSQIDLYNNFINEQYDSVIDMISNDSSKTSEQKVEMSTKVLNSLATNLNLSETKVEELSKKIDVMQKQSQQNETINNKNIEIRKDFEYVISQMMNHYGYTRDQAINSIAKSIKSENFIYIKQEGNARSVLMRHSIHDLLNGLEIINNDVQNNNSNFSQQSNQSMSIEEQLSNGILMVDSKINTILNQMINGVMDRYNSLLGNKTKSIDESIEMAELGILLNSSLVNVKDNKIHMDDFNNLMKYCSSDYANYLDLISTLNPQARILYNANLIESLTINANNQIVFGKPKLRNLKTKAILNSLQTTNFQN